MPYQPVATSKSLKLAFEHNQAGRFDQAEKICRKILAAEPKNAGANYLLGILVCQTGQIDSGIEFIRKAIQYEPQNPWAHISLGNALKSKGNLEDAIHSYETALAIKPDNPGALFNLANTLKDQGELGKAIKIYKKIIALKPDFFRAYHNLANVLKKQGHFTEAISCYRKAISLNPNFAVTHNNLGNILFIQGNCDNSIICYKNAIALKPDYPEPYNGLGNAHLFKGLSSDAINFIQKALELRPDYPLALNCLGNAYKDQGLLNDAVASYRKALSIDPRYEIAHSNLLFLLNYLPHITQEEIYKESLSFAETHSKIKNRTKPVFSIDNSKSRKLRIGYISPDFRAHSVAFFFQPLLQAHDRNNFDIFCYSDVTRPDEITERIKGEADHWLTIIEKNDTDVGEQIKKDRIDILVDLAGHTANNRLTVFAQKPASVQVTWLGYPNTTGLHTIDYRFTDAIATTVLLMQLQTP
jgi:predicted O-linked N-acetylglucosamine transferase (SPINDLY family)